MNLDALEKLNLKNTFINNICSRCIWNMDDDCKKEKYYEGINIILNFHSEILIRCINFFLIET